MATAGAPKKNAGGTGGSSPARASSGGGGAGPSARGGARIGWSARGGARAEALDALALMRRIGSSTTEPYTLASALTACRGDPGGAAAGSEEEAESAAVARRSEALEALDAFERAGADAAGTVAVKNAAIALYADVGRTDDAFALYESMRREAEAEAEAERSRSIALGAEASGSTASEASGSAAASPGLSVAATGRASAAPDTITYNTLIAACAASNRPDARARSWRI